MNKKTAIRPGDFLINAKKANHPCANSHGKVKRALWINWKQNKESSISDLCKQSGLGHEEVVDALCLLRDRNEAIKTINNLWIPQKAR